MVSYTIPPTHHWWAAILQSWYRIRYHNSTDMATYSGTNVVRNIPLDETRRLINELLLEKDTTRKKKNFMSREIKAQLELIEEVKSALSRTKDSLAWYLGERYSEANLRHLQRELTLLYEIQATI